MKIKPGKDYIGVGGGVLSYSWLDFHRAEEIIAKGIEEAIANIEEIQQKTGYRRAREPKTIFERIVDFYASG